MGDKYPIRPFSQTISNFFCPIVVSIVINIEKWGRLDSFEYPEVPNEREAPGIRGSRRQPITATELASENGVGMGAGVQVRESPGVTGAFVRRLTLRG
jgi:hypothetical protein